MQSAGPQVAGPAPLAVAPVPTVPTPEALAVANAAPGDAAAEQTLLQKNRAFWAQQKGFSHIVYDAFVYVPGPPNGDRNGQIRNIFNSKLCSSKTSPTRLVDSFLGACTPGRIAPLILFPRARRRVLRVSV